MYMETFLYYIAHIFSHCQLFLSRANIWPIQYIKRDPEQQIKTFVHEPRAIMYDNKLYYSVPFAFVCNQIINAPIICIIESKMSTEVVDIHKEIKTLSSSSTILLQCCLSRQLHTEDTLVVIDNSCKMYNLPVSLNNAVYYKDDKLYVGIICWQ